VEIARRYFALNLFDGILTVLGFTVNYFFLGGRSPSVLLASGLIISIGMAISGLTSAMLVEYSELQKELNELEKALFRDLDGTHIARAKMATALMNALVNAVAPMLGALAVLFPILLSSFGLIGFSQGFMLSLLLSVLSLFLLGVYLGKNAGNRPIARAVRLIKIVLDVLKPGEIPVYHLATSPAELENVQQVTVDVIEVDVKTETVKLTVEGTNLDINDVLRHLEETGCSVRSIDSVAVKKQ
jgi:hypothetical protein